MKKTIWGPCIWKTLHILTIKIKDQHFAAKKKELIHTIMNICGNLPCPICSSHANSLLKRYRFQNVSSKESMITILINIHNEVNKRLKKPLKDETEMKNYYNKLATREILQDYYMKMKSMHFGEKMMLYSFRRKVFIQKFKQFINENIKCFDE